MEIKGFEVVDCDSRSIRVKVGAGEVWDTFVATTVRRGWHGAENMALIPGTVGAAPINNIGAYGQEVGAIIDSVEAWDTQTGRVVVLRHPDCRFGYRSSAFNCVNAQRYIILHVTFQLSKGGWPEFTPAMRQRLTVLWQSRFGVAGSLAARLISRRACLPGRCYRAASLRAARAAVLSLRTDGRLPDTRIHGNAGSFFKAALLTQEQFKHFVETVSANFSPSRARELAISSHSRCRDGLIKLAVTPLIRLCGLVDLRVGGAALWPASPAVVVNASGRAKAEDVMLLAKTIRQEIFARTGVIVPIEAQLLGFKQEELDYYLSVAPELQREIGAR